MLWIDNIDLFVAALLFAMFAGLICDMALRRYLKREELPRTAHITMAVAAVFLCLHGFSMEALRSILLCQILILAGACDAATYEIPDFLHLLIAMAAGGVSNPASPFRLCSGSLAIPDCRRQNGQNWRRRCKADGGQRLCPRRDRRCLDDDMGTVHGAFMERRFPA